MICKKRVQLILLSDQKYRFCSPITKKDFLPYEIYRPFKVEILKICLYKQKKIHGLFEVNHRSYILLRNHIMCPKVMILFML